MSFDWSRHRFSGGRLVFDLINTVVYRRAPAQRQDRLTSIAECIKFAEAARQFRCDEIQMPGGGTIERDEYELLLKLREEAYEYFRQSHEGVTAGHIRLARLLGSLAAAIKHSARMPFAADTALSALGQIQSAGSRLKQCPNCSWLFVDGSRNGSRIWCDMKVCGNRNKARRHYHRRTGRVADREASL